MTGFALRDGPDSLPHAETQSLQLSSLPHAGTVSLQPAHSFAVTGGNYVTAGPDVSFSLDPYAGLATYNGLPIYTPQQAADNLNRAGVNFTFGNNGALDDGVLTYGFWSSLDEVQHSYYTETNADGYILTADGDNIAAGIFAPFTAEQQAMAIQNIGLWDDLIAVTFRQADSAADADITFGFTQISSAAGAHTYFPQEEALDSAYGFTTGGRVAGDVWANIAYQGDFSGDNSLAGGYGWFAITHELGHSLGLSHTGDYNASDDKDGDGKPDPITYGGDAYYAQDTQQYSIMSYFDGAYTGQRAVNWDTGYFIYAQTPAVHDIVAVQQVYGADYTTRAGNTVYGFNSTADRDIFDFTHNTVPILTIWDGGGNDTLDLSGFDANNIIDINEGAFSSAGYKISAEAKAFYGSYFHITTEAQWASFFANNGLGPDGRPVANIAIAYGAQIENAVGGSGNDQINGNTLDNHLDGGAGSDSIFGNAGNDIIAGGLGNDVLSGGSGIDTASYAHASGSVVASLVAGTASGADGNDTLAGIENVTGSAYNDTISGNSGGNVLDGGAGDDSLIGNAGNDTLNGGAGNDVVAGGDGLDVMTLGAGADRVVEDLGTRVSTKAGALSWDIVTDFAAGDKIDLSALHHAFHFNGTAANKTDGAVTYKVYDSINGAENALGIDIHDHVTGTHTGPVTVVFENVDGGTPDIGLVLLDHNGVSAGDFIFA